MISMVQDIAGGQADQSFGYNNTPKTKLQTKKPALDASYYTQPQVSQDVSSAPIVNVNNPSQNPLLNQVSNYKQNKKGMFGSFDLLNPLPNVFGEGSSKTDIPLISLPNIGGSVGQGIDSLVKNPTNTIGNVLTAALEGPTKQLGEDIGISQTGATPTGTPKKTPEEIAAANAQTEQQRASAQYKEKLPYYQSRMAEDLAKESNKQMNKAQREVDERNTSRGLGYGGLNQGMQESIRSNTQGLLAKQTQEMNQGLLDLGQQLDEGTIKTGLGYQQDLQRRQDQIYQQALARQQAQNSMTGSGLGLLASYALMAAL